MINPVKILISKLYRLINKINWNKQRKHVIEIYRKGSYQDRRNVRKLDISLLGNILIIVPHADDELISCYQLIKEGAPKVWLYYIGHYPIKDPELKRTRDRELAFLGKKLDAKIISNITNHSDGIAQAISRLSIDTVFTPDFVDWHEDHQHASIYLKDALELVVDRPEIFTYSVTVPTPFLGDVYALFLTKRQQSEKWNMFNRIYKSQRFMPLFRFSAQERINAYGIKDVYAAEIFQKISFQDFAKKAKNRPNKKERDYIYTLINNIYFIRKYVDK